MSQETKIKIIAAARKLFVAKGFAGTSMSMISELAKVNHALLFYHYKNKENLWTETKIAIFQEATKSSKLLPDNNLPFETFLKKLISNTVKFYQDNPDMIRMVNWQRLEMKNKIQTGGSDEYKLWVKTFQSYQNQGKISQNVKVEFLITMILSILISIFLDNYVYINDQKSIEEYEQFVFKILIEGLSK